MVSSDMRSVLYVLRHRHPRVASSELVQRINAPMYYGSQTLRRALPIKFKRRRRRREVLQQRLVRNAARLDALSQARYLDPHLMNRIYSYL